MARINVDTFCFLDPRFRKLAREAKLANSFEAIGRCQALWGVCLEAGRHELTREEVLDIHPDVPQLFDALVAADLAERTSEDTVYVRGTRGRIEWLEIKRTTARENGAKGGRPPKRKPIPETNVGFQPETNEETPPAPVLVPVPTLAPENSRSGSRPKADRFEADSEAMALARHLFDAIRSNDPKAKEPRWETWATEIDRLNRIDGRDLAEIRLVIDWCQRDQFWRANVLSPAALRKSYQKLLLKMRGEESGTQPRSAAVRPRFVPIAQVDA